MFNYYGGYPQMSTPQYNGPQYINQPYATQQYSAVTNTNKIYVNGIEDAKNRPLPQNSDYIFLDNDKAIIYQKIVDANGKFEMKVFDIVPHKDEVAKPTEYVTRADFNALQCEFCELKNKLSSLTQTRLTSASNQAIKGDLTDGPRNIERR